MGHMRDGTHFLQQFSSIPNHEAKVGPGVGPQVRDSLGLMR